MSLSDIKYDVGEYQKSCDLVRDARDIIKELPDHLQEQIRDITKMAVKGTYLACKSIYEPTTDPKEVDRAGSDSDFETDKKGLSELENYFD